MAKPGLVTTSVPPRPVPSDSPGPLPRVFGRYVLFDRIGRGGMADIYLARADTSLGGSRLCVLKQILPELGRDPVFERSLIEEAKLAARLTHANVVQVFDLGRESDRLFIGMEYVEGFDLNQLLRALSKAKVALPAEFAIFMVREVLRALDYAHRLRDEAGRPFGVVHRDVSPSNVLISFEGEVKLCDFGIARALTARDDGEGVETAHPPGKVVGKSAYMSPEHARGEPIDTRADVFSAGILLWELCAGKRLYKGTEEEMLALAKQAKVSPLPQRGLPQEAKLQAVLDRALARFRDDRYQSAAEFLRALEDYAMSVKLMASQLRFGAFLTDNFAKEIVELRRERERSVRTMPSQIPPATVAAKPIEQPKAIVEEDDDDEPTRIADSPMDQKRPSDPPRIPPVHHDRVWNEPGAMDRPERPLDSGKIVLQELGTDQERVPPAPPARQVTEVELDRSLMGLELLAEQTNEEVKARALAPPIIDPPQAAHGPREWIWYATAAAILAGSVLAYFLT